MVCRCEGLKNRLKKANAGTDHRFSQTMSFSSHVVARFDPKDKDTVREACVALAADGVLSRWRARGGLLTYKPCGPYGASVSRKVLFPVIYTAPSKESQNSNGSLGMFDVSTETLEKRTL